MMIIKVFSSKVTLLSVVTLTVLSTAVLVGTALQCATGTSRHVSEGILTHLVTWTRDTSELDTSH